ncbi:pyrroline-5-carboxylate reductase [Helicobacter jaachi]|uniref:Pyrroline-5-carboxylate reductase n=1 Tax=Helicobacter jaachi TaxID=1677920 RepID=A0A4U8TCQ7_9HELI|nr:pyrroline-5-carboxylate reductase [Helicobacter jaachi]TLD97454.1 pyrroline-5-carboxylate reductase [Helicobacter jaachi]
MKRDFVVVGYGNMAQAILAHNDFLTTHYNHIFIIGRHLEKAKACIAEHNLKAKALQASLVDSKICIDIEGKDVLLCIKPKGLESFIFTGEAHSVYSVLAGVPTLKLTEHLKAHFYVRLMPNIAAWSKASSTAFYCLNAKPCADFADVVQKHILPFIQSFGEGVQVNDEALIESSIATSGSSIAFLAIIAESLIDAGVLEGLSHEQSAALVQQTFAGFAKILAHTSPSELKYAISSPAGTTIRGLALLEERGLRGILIKAAHTSAQYARDYMKNIAEQTKPHKA